MTARFYTGPLHQPVLHVKICTIDFPRKYRLEHFHYVFTYMILNHQNFGNRLFSINIFPTRPPYMGKGANQFSKTWSMIECRMLENGHQKSTMPKTASLPIVHSLIASRHEDEEPHYAIPPQLETPRDAGPVVHDVPATMVAKRILLTESNKPHQLRLYWALMIIQILFSSSLLALGAYHVIESYRDAQDAPNTYLSEQVQMAPSSAVSLYYESVSILQLSLIALFTGALGFAAYFPHGARHASKMAYLIFTCLSIYLSLNIVASIGEDISHRINWQRRNEAYRIAQLCIVPCIVILLMITAYPACRSFVVYKFEKQTSKLVRIFHAFITVISVLIFLAHIHVCAVAVNRGYKAFFLSPFKATVRLSFGVCALPVSVFGLLIGVGSMKAICHGARPIGVWMSLLSASGLLVMYNCTPLLAGLFQDVMGDEFNFIYMIQFILHCASVLAWTLMILAGAVYAYVR